MSNTIPRAAMPVTADVLAAYTTGGTLSHFEFQRRLRLAALQARILECAAIDEPPEYVCPLCGSGIDTIEEQCPQCGQLFDAVDDKLVAYTPPIPQSDRKGHRL